MAIIWSDTHRWIRSTTVDAMTVEMTTNFRPTHLRTRSNSSAHSRWTREKRATNLGPGHPDAILRRANWPHGRSAKTAHLRLVLDLSRQRKIIIGEDGHARARAAATTVITTVGHPRGPTTTTTIDHRPAVILPKTGTSNLLAHNPQWTQ